MIRLLGRLLLFLSLMCAGLSPAMATERAPLVLAAASLQESLTAAADAWAAKGHARPVLSFAGSSALARSEEHTSELQSLMRISYAVFCLKKKINQKNNELITNKHVHTLCNK